MPQIVDICRQARLRLIEDCSHAHGALIDDKLVGTFGDAAVWSLQGKKIVTGGEGGILLCDDDEIYYRALLQGQYNMRCRQEIPKEHPLAQFALTGFGLKLRAHPFAIAMANEQFSYLEEWLDKKNEFAALLTEAIEPFPFIRPPRHPRRHPSWYAYVFHYCPTGDMPAIEDFFKALQAEGMEQIDRQGSTRPLTNLPLFTNPAGALPRLYSNKASQVRTNTSECPNSERFFHSAIKLPVWAHEADRPVVLEYCAGLKKVCSHIMNHTFS
jgi:dTDP-4-amino-4,6-dideoxygalactose transaminase